MGAPGLLLEIRMLVGSGLRPDIQAVCVTDPVDSIDVHPAPLVGVLILVDVLVLNAQDVQAQAGRPGAAGAGGGALNEVAVGVVVVSAAHGVDSNRVRRALAIPWSCCSLLRLASGATIFTASAYAWASCSSVPRDRKGEFEPQVLKKHQTSISQDIEEKILSMYAKG